MASPNYSQKNSLLGWGTIFIRHSKSRWCYEWPNRYFVLSQMQHPIWGFKGPLSRVLRRNTYNGALKHRGGVSEHPIQRSCKHPHWRFATPLPALHGCVSPILWLVSASRHLFWLKGASLYLIILLKGQSGDLWVLWGHSHRQLSGCVSCGFLNQNVSKLDNANQTCVSRHSIYRPYILHRSKFKCLLKLSKICQGLIESRPKLPPPMD